MEGDLPKHVAIIMDGNGRWAQTRHFGRTLGHHEGAKRVDEIVSECADLGIRYLTLYAFSTENWNRPATEIKVLMGLLVQHLSALDKKLVKNHIRLLSKGQVDRLPGFARNELQRVVDLTNYSDPKMSLTLCLSYGGRQEIVDAVKALAQKVQDGKLAPDAITESMITEHLYQPDVPDPDLLIRTGGEYRVSNFLLWEIAYTELYVTPTLWPDFTLPELHKALDTYQHRERRYGKTSEQVVSTPSAP